MLAKGIFYFLAGLGILLFGVSVMSGGLEKVTGSKVRKGINRFSKNRVQSFGVGLATTFLLQSSTAASIMFVGFASSGIISLFQAIGMIIGSNVGTTLTSVILSFKSINAIEILSVFVLIGVIVKLVAKKQKHKEFGNVLIGLGLLFAGMLLIDEATAIFKSYEAFNVFIASITNPIVLVLLGIVITVLTQSSLGTIAILISLAGAGDASYAVMSLQNMSFVIYGANIGTCITAVLVALNSNANGKRVAFFHVLFNVFGTVVFSLLALTQWTNLLLPLEPSIAIILINIIFNSVTAVLLLPFAKPITKLMNKTFSKNNSEQKLFVLNKNELEIPTIAIKSINKAMTESFEQMKFYVLDFKQYIQKIDVKKFEEMQKKLALLSLYMQSIRDNALKIGGDLSELDSKNLTTLFEVASNYERVVHNLTEILDSTVSEDKVIDFTHGQITIMQELSDEIINIINAYKRVYIHIYNETYDFDFGQIVEAVMQCTDYITTIKNNQKKRLVTQLKKKNNEKYGSFLNITNQFDEIGNDFNDISVNLSELLIKQIGDIE